MTKQRYDLKGRELQKVDEITAENEVKVGRTGKQNKKAQKREGKEGRLEIEMGKKSALMNKE